MATTEADIWTGAAGSPGNPCPQKPSGAPDSGFQCSAKDATAAAARVASPR